MTTAYSASDTNPAAIAKLPTYTMQCVDCHNRPTHAFEVPEKAVDLAMAGGAIPVTLPFIKKKSVEVLKKSTPARKTQRRRSRRQLPAIISNPTQTFTRRGPMT